MSNQYSICKKCHNVVIKRGCSIVWKIPTRKTKEEHVHETYNFWLEFGFSANKLRKQALDEYWKLQDQKSRDYNKSWNLAIEIVLKRWKND